MAKIGLISTSANPLHVGHLAMAEWGVKNGYKPIFEISRCNADKGYVDELEINRRNAKVVNAGYDVINLDEPLFRYKAIELINLYRSARFPYLMKDIWFFVGFDTAVRINNPKYYESDYLTNEQMRDKMIRDTDLKFVVFERNGQSDLSVLSPVLRERCVLAENYQSVNISSTELRQHGLKQHGY